MCNSEENGERGYCPKLESRKEGYIAGAEPREKRIDELKTTNKRISDECHKLVDTLEKKQKEIAELETRCNELFLQTCEPPEKIKELKSEIENDRDLPAIAYMQGGERERGKRCITDSSAKNAGKPRK